MTNTYKISIFNLTQEQYDVAITVQQNTPQLENITTETIYDLYCTIMKQAQTHNVDLKHAQEDVELYESGLIALDLIRSRLLKTLRSAFQLKSRHTRFASNLVSSISFCLNVVLSDTTILSYDRYKTLMKSTVDISAAVTKNFENEANLFQQIYDFIMKKANLLKVMTKDGIIMNVKGENENE